MTQRKHKHEYKHKHVFALYGQEQKKNEGSK